MKSIAIVVVNYNKKEMLKKCLEALLEQKFSDFEIYVVDNASEDGSSSMIKNDFPTVSLIENKENLGGSGGFNTGLREAYKKGYSYFMCVDNDAFLDENAVETLYRFLKTHPKVGMAASRIYHLEDPDYIQNNGQKIDFDAFCTEVLDLNKPEDSTLPPYVFSDGVPACSLMVRREVIQKIGFLPEKNFLYWDDTEWCYLCNRAGYKVASVGASKALHSMGAKKEDISTFPTYYAWRNWITFFMRYTPKEKCNNMMYTFLSSIFQVQFEGYLAGEFNRANTVMAAYDDAIHNVTGRAGEERIFPVDRNEEELKQLFMTHKTVYVEENGMPNLLKDLTTCAKKYAITLQPFTEKDEITGDLSVAVVHLCYSVLSETTKKQALTLEHRTCHYFWDVSDCLLMAENVMDILHDYNKARELFIFSQVPVFMRAMDEIRKQ